jgi:hypothetical protein
MDTKRHKCAEPRYSMTVACEFGIGTLARGSGMQSKGMAIALALLCASPVFANEIDQMASNLEKSCSNHFRKRPNRPSNDSRKFCRCFAAEFTSTVSLREIDSAAGSVTSEIQEQFERAAENCGRDVAPSVAQAGRAWATQDN